MTESREQSAFVPSQPGKRAVRQTEESPTRAPGPDPGSPLRPPVQAEVDNIEKEVREELNDLMVAMGERGLGGPWDPGADLQVHTTSELDSTAKKRREELTGKLTKWSKRPGSEPVQLLMCLWRESWDLWERCLAYRTVQVVEQATADFVNAAAPPPSVGQPEEGWEPEALRAVGQAMSLITADADVYKQINLSSPDELAKAAGRAVETTKVTLKRVRSVLAALGSLPGEPGDGSDRTAGSLREIKATADQNQLLHGSIIYAAEALIRFESWLATAPRLGSAEPRPPAAGLSSSHALRQTLLESVGAAIDHLHLAQSSLSGSLLSESEPWEQLLVEIRDIVTPRDGAAAKILVPKRASIRYCYPFAVEADERRSLKDRDRLRTLLKTKLDDTLKGEILVVGEPKPLEPTEFFASQDSETTLYGGLRVELSNIELRHGQSPGVNGDGQGQLCRVWADLSLMGNHCLCVEPVKPLEAPLPHLLYRAFRAGTPFTLGATAVLAEPPAGAQVAWDNLHLFSRDVIRAIAHAGFWEAEEHIGFWKMREEEESSRELPFVRGNLHEVVIVRTDGPLGVQLEDVAAKLDHAVGGRILMRSIQRAATTLEEWVRYPPAQRTERQGRVPAIAAVSEIGLGGDWVTYTGETTVFGIAAAPEWHSDVYVEAAQFANSWSPRLRQWSKRLQRASQASESDVDKTPGDDIARRAEELRRVELGIRQHLSQIQSEELCATLAHRRFLDQLLEMAGLGRLQRELEAQLEAAEHLTDWFSEREQRRVNRRREALLGLIALFGLFDLGTFLALANTTNFHERFLFIMVRQGVWEDWLLLTLFLLALLAGVYFFNMHKWLHGHLGAARRKPGRRRSGQQSGDGVQ
jgi:hypothetical protein